MQLLKKYPTRACMVRLFELLWVDNNSINLMHEENLVFIGIHTTKGCGGVILESSLPSKSVSNVEWK